MWFVRYILHLACLFSAILPAQAQANSAVLPWKFDCPAVSSIQEDVQNWVIDGLEELSGINPEMVGVAKKRLENTPLTWDCPAAIHPLAGAAIAYFDGTVSSRMRIVITPLGLENLNMALEGHDRSLRTLRNAVFHEVLHFLGFDNLTATEHNQSLWLEKRWPIGVNPDAVYACVAQVYPDHRTLDARPTAEDVRIFDLFSRSVGTCEMCARIRPVDRWKTQLSYRYEDEAAAVKVCAQTEEVLLERQTRAKGRWVKIPTK